MLELLRSKILRDPELRRMADVLAGATALEPGGPSALFDARGPLPLYPRLKALDTLDFSERTLWSAGAAEISVELRHSLIGEARAIPDVPEGSYDAVLGSHVIEHLADPLGALGEWQRVVRPGGHILLVVPHRDGTFDHRRPVTPLEHLREDARLARGEDDLTHLPEILELHDLERDPGVPSREVFEARCRDNASTRGMHHHVFDTRAVADLCHEAGLVVEALRPKQIHDIYCLCRVVGDGASERGEGLTDDELARILRNSRFVSDRASA